MPSPRATGTGPLTRRDSDAVPSLVSPMTSNAPADLGKRRHPTRPGISQPAARYLQEGAMDKIIRLSVNLNSETADALKELASRRGVSLTEGIRRAIGIWKFVEDAQNQGSTILVDDGERTRELVLL